ncbi:MAG: NAD-dependent epimerase/dehydratase family protein [Oligoflexales bacterium]
MIFFSKKTMTKFGTKISIYFFIMTFFYTYFLINNAVAKERTILITGASGHLGISLIELLTQDPQIKIKALVHHNEQRIVDLKKQIEISEPSITSRIQIYKVDILDYESIQNAFFGVDIVFHLAAVISIQSEKKALEHMRTVNVEGTRNVLRASKAAAIKYFIHCSSTHAYRHLPDLPLSTDNGLVDFDDLVYDATKAASQHLVAEFSKKHDDFHHVIIAPSGIIGRNDHPDTDMWPLFERFSIVRFSPITTGGYAFIDVQVLAGIMKQAMDQLMDKIGCERIDGEQFIVGGKSVSVLEMVKQLQEVTGKRHCLNLPGGNRPIQLPLKALEIIAPWYEAIASFLGFKALITSYSIGVLGSLTKGIAEKEHRKLEEFFDFPDVSLKQTFYDRYLSQNTHLHH